MSGLSVWLCNPEAALHAQLAADTDRAWLEWNRQEDIDHEQELAREAVDSDETDEWPWYADAPIEVVDPDVVETEEPSCAAPTERTCLTCLDPIDEDDECSCIGPGWETP